MSLFLKYKIMFPFKQRFNTFNKTSGINAKQFIIIHHTGTKEGSLEGVIHQLTEVLSCHFLIDTDGSAYKIGSPDDILWHAGVSEWGDRTDMNRFAMGIEFIGPLENGGFTKEQKETGKKLIEHLMAIFNIPHSNILKHADITWEGSQRKEYWDWISPSRKVDIARTFVEEYNNSWTEFVNSLVPYEM